VWPDNRGCLLIQGTWLYLPFNFNPRCPTFNFVVFEILFVCVLIMITLNTFIISNHNFHNYVHLIYLAELEKKYTTESDKSASYLDILRNIDSNGTDWQHHYMSNLIILTLQLPTFLSSVVICHFHQPMVCISKLIRYERESFANENISNEANNWQKVDVAGL
jgi:hypothetical protein